MKIGVIGHVLPLRHPVQTAEEFAQIDILSGGRFIGGIVRGVPQEYVSYNVDPFTSRERFAESFDILQKCLTEEIFDYEGKFYNLKAVSIWPKPLQKPLPIWMPAGSAETIEFAAERKIPIAQVWSPPLAWQDIYDYYSAGRRRAFRLDAGPAAHDRRTLHPRRRNQREGDRGMPRRRHVRAAPIDLQPAGPGARAGSRASRPTAPSISASTPASACPVPARRSTSCARTASSSAATPTTSPSGSRTTWRRRATATFLGMFRVGSMKHEHVMNAKRLFAAEVMPRLRGLNQDSGSEVEKLATAGEH